MKVVITGANSAVGQAIFRCSTGNTVRLVAAVRSGRAEEEIRHLLRDSDAVVRISYDDAQSLRTAFQDACAVIHLAGILVEQPGSTYEQANLATTGSVVEAAKKCGVKKVVFVSATGASETSSNGYWRSKGQAEALVRESGLSYTVLRVPLLLGFGTEGALALKRNSSGGRAMLIGGGQNLQQPLHVNDLARAAILAADPSVASNRTLELVGPLSLTERELVERASRIAGRQVRIWPLPKIVVKFALAIRKLTAKRGFSLDALEVITVDTCLDPQPAAREIGIELTGIDTMIKDSLAP